MRNWVDKISENISYTEATKSRTAIEYNINNTPSNDILEKMKLTANKIFEPLREHFGVPIAVTSFFRSKKLNKKIGGSTTSQHCKGEALDIDADVLGLITNKQIFDYIKNNLEFDQLIWEYGTNKEPDWVHVSYSEGRNRCKILKAYKEKNWHGQTITKYKTIY